VRAALEAVFDNDIIVDEQRPTTLPARQVILKMYPMNILELWSDLRQTCFKAGIMVSEEVNVGSLPGGIDDFTEAFLASFQLFLDRWAAFPTYRGVPTNARPVDSISVANHGYWVKYLAELDKSTVGD
jgi:hypothetical protein